MNVEELDQSVETVADFLDDDKPDWTQTLVDLYGADLYRLKVSDPNACVLSALYGNYSRGYNVLSEAGIGGNNREWEDAIACNSHDDHHVRIAWQHAIERRS